MFLLALSRPGGGGGVHLVFCVEWDVVEQKQSIIPVEQFPVSNKLHCTK